MVKYDRIGKNYDETRQVDAKHPVLGQRPKQTKASVSLL